MYLYHNLFHSMSSEYIKTMHLNVALCTNIDDGVCKSKKNHTVVYTMKQAHCIVSREGYVFANKVRREQAVGTEDVKVTAMNMCKYKEGVVFLQTLAM